jgi:hypothetical protein
MIWRLGPSNTRINFSGEKSQPTGKRWPGCEGAKLLGAAPTLHSWARPAGHTGAAEAAHAKRALTVLLFRCTVAFLTRIPLREDAPLSTRAAASEREAAMRTVNDVPCFLRTILPHFERAFIFVRMCHERNEKLTPARCRVGVTATYRAALSALDSCWSPKEVCSRSNKLRDYRHPVAPARPLHFRQYRKTIAAHCLPRRSPSSRRSACPC